MRFSHKHLLPTRSSSSTPSRRRRRRGENSTDSNSNHLTFSVARTYSDGGAKRKNQRPSQQLQRNTSDSQLLSQRYFQPQQQQQQEQHKPQQYLQQQQKHRKTVRFNEGRNVYIPKNNQQWRHELVVAELWYSKSELMRLKNEHVETVKRILRLIQSVPEVPQDQEQQQVFHLLPLLRLRQALLDVYHACQDGASPTRAQQVHLVSCYIQYSANPHYPVVGHKTTSTSLSSSSCTSSSTTANITTDTNALVIRGLEQYLMGTKGLRSGHRTTIHTAIEEIENNDDLSLHQEMTEICHVSQCISRQSKVFSFHLAMAAGAASTAAAAASTSTKTSPVPSPSSLQSSLSSSPRKKRLDKPPAAKTQSFRVMKLGTTTRTTTK